MATSTNTYQNIRAHPHLGLVQHLWWKLKREPFLVLLLPFKKSFFVVSQKLKFCGLCILSNILLWQYTGCKLSFVFYQRVFVSILHMWNCPSFFVTFLEQKWEGKVSGISWLRQCSIFIIRVTRWCRSTVPAKIQHFRDTLVSPAVRSA